MEINDTDLLYREYRNTFKNVLLPSTIFLCTILCTGIIGNSTVLILYCTKAMGKLTEPRYFIPVLAFYDLLACISSLTFVITETFIWLNYSDMILCKVVILVFLNAAGSSTSILVVIAVQRYIKICRPHSKQMTLSWRRIALTLVIIANIVYYIPAGFFCGIENYEFVYKNTSISIKKCVVVRENSGVLGVVYHAIMTTVLTCYAVFTTVFYLPIAYTIFRNFYTQQKYRINKNKKHFPAAARVSAVSSKDISSQVVVSRKYEKAKSNFTRMFLTIITVYLLSYAPSCVVIVYQSVDTRFWISRPFSDLALWFILAHCYVINHAVNPLIYVYFDTNMRRKLVEIVCTKSLSPVLH